MPFTDIEISESDNAPIELYELKRGSTFWRYTSYDENVIFNSNVFRAISLKRPSIESNQDINKNSIKISMDRGADFLDQFISDVPTDVISLDIIRLHSGNVESVITWKGRVINVKFVEELAEVTCQSIYSSLKRPGLRRLYQINCPHVLYGTECKVIKAVFEIPAVISAVSTNKITSPSFIVSINPTFDADWFVGGLVEFVVNGLTTRRFVTEHNNNTGELTLNLPFTGLSVNNSVKAFPGCDHSNATCNGKFTNILHYGGFPFIPIKNPMDGTPVF